MCSQPPIDKDDAHALTERNLKLIDLMTPAPDYLCITGGEPTLLEERLLTIVAKLRAAGAVIIGLATEVSAAYITPSYKYVIAFAALLIMLGVRPAGLLGKAAA